MGYEPQYLPEKQLPNAVIGQSSEDNSTEVRLEVEAAGLSPRRPLESSKHSEGAIAERLSRIRHEAFRERSSVARNAVLDLADRKNFTRGELYEVSQTLVAVIQQCRPELADVARSALKNILTQNSHLPEDQMSIAVQIFEYIDHRNPLNAELADTVMSIVEKLE